MYDFLLNFSTQCTIFFKLDLWWHFATLSPSLHAFYQNWFLLEYRRKLRSNRATNSLLLVKEPKQEKNQTIVLGCVVYSFAQTKRFPRFPKEQFLVEKMHFLLCSTNLLKFELSFWKQFFMLKVTLKKFLMLKVALKKSYAKSSIKKCLVILELFLTQLLYFFILIMIILIERWHETKFKFQKCQTRKWSRNTDQGRVTRALQNSKNSQNRLKNQ